MFRSASLVCNVRLVNRTECMQWIWNSCSTHSSWQESLREELWQWFHHPPPQSLDQMNHCQNVVSIKLLKQIRMNDSNSLNTRYWISLLWIHSYSDARNRQDLVLYTHYSHCCSPPVPHCRGERVASQQSLPGGSTEGSPKLIYSCFRHHWTEALT